MREEGEKDGGEISKHLDTPPFEYSITKCTCYHQDSSNSISLCRGCKACVISKTR